jgi:hypothetical protein
VGEAIARLSIVSHSGFDAMKATMSADIAQYLSPQWALSSNLGMIAALFIVFFLAAFLGLKLKDYSR